MKRGTIIDINNNELTVQAVCQAACANCHQRQNCLLTEYQKKIENYDYDKLQAEKQKLWINND